jgi:hypothetical protein
MSFVPDFSPHFHWQWLTGTGHTGSNPGGIDGRLLTFGDFATEWARQESECDWWGINTFHLNLLPGALLGQNCPVASWGILAASYPHIATWLTTVFPTARRAGRRYGLYMGGRQNGPPFSQTEYETAGSVIPPGSFFVESVAPFKALGFSHVWTDATDGSALDAPLQAGGPAANNALAAAGWRAGSELLPHTGIIYPGNTLDVDDARLLARPSMVVWRNWRDLFRSRYTRNFPAGSEVHICPQFGDSDLTTTICDEIWAKGGVISPYSGFKDFAPTVASYIRDRIRSARPRGWMQAAHTR